MPRFIFKLEPVLKQRTAVEREKQLVVAHLESQRVDLESTIRSAQNAIDASRNELRELLGNSSHTNASESRNGEGGGSFRSSQRNSQVVVKSVNLFGARLQAASTLQASVSAQRAVIKLAGIFTRLVAARADLANAMKRRRAVELLREARFEEWKRELQRKESELLDEVGTRIASENSHA